MRIERVELLAYRLPFAAPFHGVDRTHTERRGFLLRLVDGEGRSGWGETAPFPGMRAEALDAARGQLSAFLPRLRGRDIPPALAALDGGLVSWLGAPELLPSVRFGIESALLSLAAAERQLPLRTLLRADAASAVPINVLFDGREPDLAERADALRRAGIRAFKLKVGRGDDAGDIANARKLRDAIGREALLRLDAKCAWELPRAVRVGAALAPLAIDYLEEPLQHRADLAAFHAATGIPTALDENLHACLAGGAAPPAGVRAFVIKPDIVGGLTASAEYCRRAHEWGVLPIISATFLSGIGVRVLAELAAAYAPPEVPMGLGTSAWLAEDLFDVPVRAGALDLAALPPDTTPARPDLLSPIPLQV